MHKCFVVLESKWKKRSQQINSWNILLWHFSFLFRNMLSSPLLWSRTFLTKSVELSKLKEKVSTLFFFSFPGDLRTSLVSLDNLFLPLVWRCDSPPTSSASSRVRKAAWCHCCLLTGFSQGGALGTMKGGKVSEGRAFTGVTRGISKPLNCGEKYTPQRGRRYTCCPWAYTRAGIIMALNLIIPLPHTSLMHKCSKGWSNMLRENTTEETKPSLNQLPAPEKLFSWVY